VNIDEKRLKVISTHIRQSGMTHANRGINRLTIEEGKSWRAAAGCGVTVSSGDCLARLMPVDFKQEKGIELKSPSMDLFDFQFVAPWYGQSQTLPYYFGCSSYKSPLMLFFDQQRPRFTGRSDFPLFNNTGTHSWVEP